MKKSSLKGLDMQAENQQMAAMALWHGRIL